MLYELIEVSRGKTVVVMVASKGKVNDRLRTLRASRRGDKVQLTIRPSESAEKFQKRHRFRSH